MIYLFKISAKEIILRYRLTTNINNETELKNEVAFIPVDRQVCNNEKIMIIKGSIKIELDSSTPYSSVEPLLKLLL